MPAATFTVLWLAGCAGLPRPAVVDDEQAAQRWHRHYEKLARLQEWVLHGKLGVRTADAADIVSLVWRRAGDRHDVDLFGPLGGRRVSVHQDPSGASMTDAKGMIDQAATAAELISRQTGWDLPIDKITYWVTGIPAPGEERHQIDAEGRLVRLIQAGWQVEFVDYRDHDSLTLPGKIIASRPHERDGQEGNFDIKVKMVISRWEFPSRPAA